MIGYSFYIEEEFKDNYPKLYDFCKEALEKDGGSWDFGECYTFIDEDEIYIYYNNDENENRSAVFIFDKNFVCLEMNLNNID